MTACPCGGADRFVDCCGRWQAAQRPPTAEALMRSRYSAYVRGDRDWLLLTWHPSTRPAQLTLEPQTRWLGLQVLAAPPARDGSATVHFKARWRLGGGRAQRMEEISRFVWEQGCWWYIDGEVAVR